MDPYVPMVSKSAPHVNTTNVLDPVSADIPVKLKKQIGLENILIYRFYQSLLKTWLQQYLNWDFSVKGDNLTNTLQKQSTSLEILFYFL